MHAVGYTMGTSARDACSSMTSSRAGRCAPYRRVSRDPVRADGRRPRHHPPPNRTRAELQGPRQEEASPRPATPSSQIDSWPRARRALHIVRPPTRRQLATQLRIRSSSFFGARRLVPRADNMQDMSVSTCWACARPAAWLQRCGPAKAIPDEISFIAFGYRTTPIFT